MFVNHSDGEDSDSCDGITFEAPRTLGCWAGVAHRMEMFIKWLFHFQHATGVHGGRLTHSHMETDRSTRSAHLSVVNTGSSTASLKKPRSSRGLLSSFFCCFGTNNNNNNNNAQNNCQVPQLQENGNPKPMEKYLLPPVRNIDSAKKCVVIDLDETLVHSSFKPISNADFIVPVEIDGTVHQVYVLKRPYVDEFLQKMGEMFECVLFTASLAKYADPVADLLDRWSVFKTRLFRESCVFHRGNYVKDLSRLGRDLHQVVIVDNSPASYIFHPDNAVPVASWFDDMSDTELLDLLPFFENLAQEESVYTVLKNNTNSPASTPPS